MLKIRLFSVFLCLQYVCMYVDKVYIKMTQKETTRFTEGFDKTITDFDFVFFSLCTI